MNVSFDEAKFGWAASRTRFLPVCSRVISVYKRLYLFLSLTVNTLGFL